MLAMLCCTVRAATSTFALLVQVNAQYCWYQHKVLCAADANPSLQATYVPTAGLAIVSKGHTDRAEFVISFTTPL
jgi:hypothetical protein